MPDRARLTRPRPGPAVLRPGVRLIKSFADQNDVARRRTGLREIRRWFLVERDPGGQGRPDYGDLLEGSVAVAALIVMVVIGVSLWLAIPLAVVTYSAVALLRPMRELPTETVDGTTAEQASIEVSAEDRAHQQLLDGALTNADVVATCFGLTRREREILPLLAQRLTDREIAERLSISHRTAMNHTANILGKLGLASRREVAAFVARHAPLQTSTSPHEPE
jgi:DNA-binding CsgD family transcriptional regulator